MPQFCANLTWLFAELDFMERFAAAKAAGFDAVEVLQPYDVPVQDVVAQLRRHELKMALINCPPPNYTGGNPGYAAVVGAEGRFQRDFRRTMRYAKALDVGCVHVVAGAAEGADAAEIYVKNLQWAADEAPKQMLTIEPINPKDKSGYFLNDFAQAREILTAVDRPNVRLQFDAYHAARIHGDVMSIWAECWDVVAHVQVAQLPHRTEPNKGVIDYPAFFAQLDRDGYSGWVSAEYGPSGTTLGGLGWLA